MRQPPMPAHPNSSAHLAADILALLVDYTCQSWAQQPITQSFSVAQRGASVVPEFLNYELNKTNGAHAAAAPPQRGHANYPIFDHFRDSRSMPFPAPKRDVRLPSLRRVPPPFQVLNKHSSAANNADSTGLANLRIQAKLAVMPFSCNAPRWVRCEEHQSEATAKGKQTDGARYHRSRERQSAQASRLCSRAPIGIVRAQVKHQISA